MKNILGLDLGTTSIGWAVVKEAERENEQSSIVASGVRLVPLTTDEESNYEKGKAITTNADRCLKRSARRNLQRYKLRRAKLVRILCNNKFIEKDTLLNEDGVNTTFETYNLRAKAAKEEISLQEFARVLLMINKKRGYKSSRKLNASEKDEGQAIDNLDVAKQLSSRNITCAEYIVELLHNGEKKVPDFYRSDLKHELELIWNNQKQYYPEILTEDFYLQINNRNAKDVARIFFARYGINTADLKSDKYKIYELRVKALKEKIEKEELANVISSVCGQINSSSSYLGAISDRSKELYFNNETIGEYQYKQLLEDKHARLKNQVFYRQDYLQEFKTIWQTQTKYHKELNDELYKQIENAIFFQRRLKSQKGLISLCELEAKEVEVEINGIKKKKLIGPKVCPKSSPLFQEFRIWQFLNNLTINSKPLEQETKETLFEVLSTKEKLTQKEISKYAYGITNDVLYVNYKEIIGNKTLISIFKACPRIKDDDSYVLDCNKDLDEQKIYRLWHLLYSYEGDNSKSGIDSLLAKLQKEPFDFTLDEAKALSKISFEDDYSNLSAKAIRKLLPYMKQGQRYDEACISAGYFSHSKQSLTKEQIENKELQKYIVPLKKNSLHNPVVEKILNQMINVVNELVDTYTDGHFDEIRIELARELKANAEQRENMSKAVNDANKANERITEILKNEFHFTHVSRNDIVRYKLYEELANNGYHTLYSNTYIPKEQIFSGNFDIEHIIPQSVRFDDSFANKTLELRSVNIEKGNDTAYDFIKNKYDIEQYKQRVKDLFSKGSISKTKYKNLLTSFEEINNGFIERDLRDSQYIAKKAKEMLLTITKNVVSTTGSITARLREDWQLVDIMKELNWDKYDKLGLTHKEQTKDGSIIKKIDNWTKRNDNRHHAMDAITIAFTKHSYIQYS